MSNTHNPEYCNTSADIRARCLPARTHRADNRKWKSCPCRHDTALWIVQNEADLYRELTRVFDAGIVKMNTLGGWSRFLTGKANKFRISAFALLRTFIVDELRLSRADAHIIIGMWASKIQEEEAEENAPAPAPEMCENCGENPIAPEVKCGFEKWCEGCDESLYSTRPPAPEPEVEEEDEEEDPEEIPWCYTDNKNAVCNCFQPCCPPSESESESDDEDEEQVEFRCVCERCLGEGWCFVSESRAKELKDMDMMESACPFPNCSADSPAPEPEVSPPVFVSIPSTFDGECGIRDGKLYIPICRMGAIGKNALLLFPRDSAINYLPIPEKMDMEWLDSVAFHLKRVRGGDYHAHSLQQNIIRPNIDKIVFDLGGISDKVKSRIENDLFVWLNNWKCEMGTLAEMEECGFYMPCRETLLMEVDCEY